MCMYIHIYTRILSPLPLAIVRDNIISRNRYAKLFLGELDLVAFDATRASSVSRRPFSFTLAGERKKGTKYVKELARFRSDSNDKAAH